MNERPPDDPTVDLPCSDEALDAGLAAAFGPDSSLTGHPETVALPGLCTPLPGGPLGQLCETDAGTPASFPSGPAETSALPSAPDRYRILGEIAHGGMGEVLHGHDPVLGRDVAVKVLLDRHQRRAVLRRRFVEEAKIAGQLQHPGIVPVYDLGQLPAPDRRPYFTMKLVRGQTLASLLAGRPTPEHDRPRFLGIFEQVCQTVAYAHSQKVIHRDLKPHNVMVGAFGEVQVMDWGLAKVLTEAARPADDGVTVPAAPEGSEPDEGTDSHTVAGSVLGTPAYMAPEQARGDVGQVDERADVFGLGAILCEILTGQPPFGGRPGEAQAEARRGRLEGAYDRLEKCGADAELVALARACLAAEPAGRPRHAGAVADAVTGYLHSVADRLRRVELERAAAEARAEEEAHTRQMAEAVAAEERKRRRLTAALAAAVLLLALAGGAGWAWYRQDREARLAEAAREVGQAVTAANLLRRQAETTGDLTRWAEAQAAARNAATLAGGRDAPAALRRQADELLREVSAAHEAARARAERTEKDRRLIARLLDIRSGAGDRLEGYNQGFAGADALYARAVRDYGVDVDAISPAQARDWLAQVGEHVRPTPEGPGGLGVELAACLDDWAHARRMTNKPDGAKRLTAVARVLDPDPLRNKARAAIDGNDLKVLRELAALPDVEAAPPATVNLIAVYMGFWGDVPGAVRLLARAQRRHPNDFQINHNLGWFLLYRMQPPGVLEALRYSTAAVAVRPQSVVARIVLAEAYAQRGTPAAGAAVLEDYARARPEAARYVLLGEFHLRRGNKEAALVALREAVRLDGKDARARALLARAEGAPERALAHPTDEGTRNDLVRALAAQGRLEEARAAWAKALAEAPPGHAAWYGYAELCLYVGQEEEYRRHRRDLLARFGRPGPEPLRVAGFSIPFAQSAGPNEYVCERVGRACLLLPGPADELRQAVALIDRAVAAGPRHPSYHHFLWAKGLAEYRQGRPERAVPLLREAAGHIEQRTPRFVLAMALFRLGQKEEARKALDEAAQKYDWREGTAYYVDAWLHHVLRREAEALLVPNLAAFLRGEYRPGDDKERLDFIARCELRRRYVAVAGLYADYFAAAKEDADQGAWRRYQAARAAALAGTGHGESAPPPGGPEAARWRKQARDWLRADLPAYGQLLEKAEHRPGTLRALRLWQQDRALAGLRDPEALRKLPADEQAECRRLWAEVAALRQRAEGVSP